MKKFLKENKIFLAIVIGALIIGGAIYFSGQKEGPLAEEQKQTQSCANIPELPNNSLKLVIKIIDGDTFLIEGGYSVRILGIDADERGYPCYEVAKKRLEELVLNKEVKLEKGNEDLDQYCRYLRYVFVDDKNVSLELVKEGVALAYISPKEGKYQKEIIEAEREARENKIGCKWARENLLEKSLLESKKLEVVDPCQAHNYYGKEVIVAGKVISTYRSKSNTIFLNFGKPYPNQCFTAVIFSSDLHRFIENPEKYYDQKIVKIRGTIKEYRGKPQIILKNPWQIEIGK